MNKTSTEPWGESQGKHGRRPVGICRSAAYVLPDTGVRWWVSLHPSYGSDATGIFRPKGLGCSDSGLSFRIRTNQQKKPFVYFV